jgi:hypothetical protein
MKTNFIETCQEMADLSIEFNKLKMVAHSIKLKHDSVASAIRGLQSVVSAPSHQMVGMVDVFDTSPLYL